MEVTMSKTRLRSVIERTVGVGCFPHQMSFLIDNPIRRLLITPEAFADRLPLTPSSRVLEVGPGSGYFSVEIARRVPAGHLELFDLQPEMLAKARRKLDAAGLANVGYTQGDAGDLPFEDSEFDVAFLVAVLGEVPDEAECLRSLQRVLRPGGVVAFHEHLPDPDFSGLPALRKLVEGEGFRFVRSWGQRWNYTASFRTPEVV
jgi:ubiquinone/menaquinone biosynthesis C-methylase UbiE